MRNKIDAINFLWVFGCFTNYTLKSGYSQNEKLGPKLFSYKLFEIAHLLIEILVRKKLRLKTPKKLQKLLLNTP